MISALRIAELCNKSGPPVNIEVVASTGSTNTDLLNRIGTLSRPTLLVAISQTQGRGRAGRSWLSEPDASLTFSLAWRFLLPLHALSGLPLAIGLAVSQALEALDVRTSLKWPNDVLKDGKKLGGILIETSIDQEFSWAVIGIGLNLVLPDKIESQIGHPAAEARWLAQIDRNVLLAALLDNLTRSLLFFESDGFSSFMNEWNKRHAHGGQSVSIVDSDRVLFEGVAEGVDILGRLLLDTASGRIEVVAGDVSLRATEGYTDAATG